MPIFVTVTGITSSVAVVFENARGAIVVTVAGIVLLFVPRISVFVAFSIRLFPSLEYAVLPAATVILLSEPQLLNTESPSVVTPAGIYMLPKAPQPENALLPTVVSALPSLMFTVTSSLRL